MSIIWVTGAKGFIGKHLCSYLSQQGDRVLGLGHGAWPSPIAIESGVSYWVNGEIEDSNLWQLIDNSGHPDLIYHLAGGSSVGVSLQSPAEDFRRTVASTATLLEWIRVHSSQTKLVVSSSAAVYGNNQILHIPEQGNYTPYSPYGFHKRSAELLCESYVQSFGLQISIVRLFSIYGTGLYKQLLWDLCSRLRQLPDKLDMNGTGKELRDWLYIEDAVKILVTVGMKITDELLIINGGTGKGTCVREVVDLTCQAWHILPEITFSGQSRPGDPLILVANIDKLDRLGFKPQYNLTQGIEKYVSWFKDRASQYPINRAE
jgi:UDP-glucose 4-epimerase